MKSYLLVLTAFLILSCKNDHKAKYYVTKKDSTIIEERILDTKNVIFSELYNKSKNETYKKKNIKVCDTLLDVTYFRFNTFDLKITGDANKNKLLRKWLDNKTYFVDKAYTSEHPNGSLDLARALDFYNSKDLANYLDSLRLVYYKGFNKIDYKKNPPTNATVPYIPLK